MVAKDRIWRRYDFLVWLFTPSTLMEGLAERWLGRPPEVGLLDRLPIVAVAAAIALLAIAIGYVAMRRLGATAGLRTLEQLVFSFGVGMALLSVFTLAFGLLGWLHTPLPWALLAAVAFAEVGRFWKARLFAIDNEKEKAAADVGAAEPVRERRSAGTGHLVAERKRSNDGSSGGRIGRPPRPRQTERILAGVCVLFGLVILLGGMLPPIEFDVREYHLQVPKEFFQQGRITFLPHNVYGNMPLGAEMSALLAMVICDDWWLGALAGKTVVAVFAVATALMLWTAGRRWFSPTAGAAAAMIYISTPWVARVSTSGLVEGVFGFFLAAAAYSFWLWRDAQAVERRAGPIDATDCSGTGRKAALREKREDDSVRAAASAAETAPGGDVDPSVRTASTKTVVGGGVEVEPMAGKGCRGDRHTAMSRLLLCGFFAGAAAAVKYTAVPLVVLPLALAVAIAGKGRRAGWLAAFLLAAAVAGGAWYVKNWALSGNPTYPLLYDLFDGRTRTPEKNAQWVAAHRPPGYSPALWANDVRRLLVGSEWIGPLAVPLALLAAVGGTRRKRVWQCLSYVAVYWMIWWLFTHRLDRFWVPMLPVLSLAAGAGFAWRDDRPWRWTVAVVAVVGIVYCLLVDVSGPGGYNRFLVRLERLRDDPERVPEWFGYLERRTPQGRQVLSVGDAAMFDLRVPVLYNTVFDTCIFEQLVRGRTPEEVRRRFRSISLVYVHWGEIARYRSPGNYGFTDFVQPEVFDRLVQQGILEPPIDRFESSGVQIFPVRHAEQSATE